MKHTDVRIPDARTIQIWITLGKKHMKKILVIDDESVIRALLRQLFERNGFLVIDAEDGRQGLDLYREESPDLVVTDLIMPEEEGLTVIKEIKKMTPDAPIIAISGGGIGKADVYLQLAKSMGAGRIFEKPFDAKAVLKAVQEMVAE